jgi:hypothetical protein
MFEVDEIVGEHEAGDESLAAVDDPAIALAPASGLICDGSDPHPSSGSVMKKAERAAPLSRV